MEKEDAGIIGSILYRMYRVARSRWFCAGCLFVVLAFSINKVSETTRAVYIRDGKNLTLTLTTDDNLHDVLSQEGISIQPEDIVEANHVLSNYAELEVRRPFTVALVDNGRRKEISIHEQTVNDLLEAQGIKLGAYDKMNMDLEDQLYDGAELTIERVGYQTRTEEREVPYRTVRTRSSLISPGQSRVIVPGSEGREVTTFTQKVVDGSVIFEEVLTTKTLLNSVTQKEIVGANAAVSPLDFGYECDEKGRPLDYVRVLRNQKATGYSARPGALTASGRYAVPGHVAVNANIIPYGTKLYIASADNSFIYGDAIAADTGTGLMDGRTDIDLFYESYTESVLNGVRYVDVYILG